MNNLNYIFRKNTSTNISMQPNSNNVGSALSGGITAQLTGGDFLQGASRGLIIAALNHGLELGLNGGTSKDQDGGNQKLTEEQLKNIRAKIVEIAKKYEKQNSDAWSVPCQRCNDFVMDVIKQAFKELKIDFKPFKEYYRAGDFGDPNKIIPGWEVVSNPDGGDIIAYKFNFQSGASGHSTISINKTGEVIYAAPLIEKSTKFIVLDNFKSKYWQSYNIKWTIRRFIGF